MSHNEERVRQATDWVKARNAGQRSLPDTRKACTRPYSPASADAHGAEEYRRYTQCEGLQGLRRRQQRIPRLG